MDLKEALNTLDRIQRKEIAYMHAMGLLSYDGSTGAPEGTAQNRGETLGVLSEAAYAVTTGKDTRQTLACLKDHWEELDDVTRRIVERKEKDLAELSRIPVEEYVAYTRLINEADAVWHKAKEQNDYNSFAPYIDKIVSARKRNAFLVSPEMDPYDYQLDKFEEGLTRSKCEAFFKTLKEDIVPLVKKVTARPQVDDAINKMHYPLAQQEVLSRKLMDLIGLDRNHCMLGVTEHPFTTGFTKYDVRITTHYHEDSFLSSLYSVIHEGGHALYELHVDDRFAYTCLGGGVSMGVHESQSRFYENIIGRSEAFCELLMPTLQELFPEQTKGFSAHDLFFAANKAEPSLIRTEADELTYTLHIMIRYEIEKKLFAGEVTSKDLPELWNALYREFLGISVPDDRRGVLQDTHWSGGMFGYFPSYALGSAYGPQILHRMEQDFDVFEAVKNNRISRINAWLCEHIWQYGCLYKPGELMEKVFNEPFDPKYYTDYLKTKYAAIYGLNE